MIKKWVGIILIIFSVINEGKAQSVIQLTKKGGVYEIPCIINGIPLNFIFDTGAADVIISRVEAKFFFKNGLLKKEDILANQYYIDATGNISECTSIMIKKLEIGNIILYNISVSVMDNDLAPLLLGQSVFRQLGPILFDANKGVLIIIDDPKINNDSTIIK